LGRREEGVELSKTVRGKRSDDLGKFGRGVG
jgi:hypothetical protein